jgi:hypothetical protein
MFESFLSETCYCVFFFALWFLILVSYSTLRLEKKYFYCFYHFSFDICLLIWVFFFFETEFYYVARANLKLAM